MSEIKVTPIGIEKANEKLNELLDRTNSIQIAINSSSWRGLSYDGLRNAKNEVENLCIGLNSVIALTKCKLVAADENFKLSDEELANMYRILGEEDVNQIINTDVSGLDEELQEA